MKALENSLWPSWKYEILCLTLVERLLTAFDVELPKMRVCVRCRRRWWLDVSVDHRGNDLYMVWIGSIRGFLWDCNRPAGFLAVEDCYLLETLRGVDEVPAYDVIQLLRLTNVNTLRFMGSDSQRHCVASLNVGIITPLWRPQKPESYGTFKKSKKANLHHFSVVGKSAFRVLDATASGLTSTAAGSRAFCDFHLPRRIKTGVLSLSSKSPQFTVIAHSVLCKLRISETVRTQCGKRRTIKNNKPRMRIRRKKRRNRKSRRKRKKWVTVRQLNMLRLGNLSVSPISLLVLINDTRRHKLDKRNAGI
jgi:hypothetical protein